MKYLGTKEGNDYIVNSESMREAIASLVGTAPETLDTIYELAAAFQSNQSVTDALQSAIGNKANKTDVDALSATIAKKADKSALDALSAVVDGLVSGGDIDLSGYATRAWVQDNYASQKALEGYLPLYGGQITGDLRLKPSDKNYGSFLRFGDGDYAYIKEASDDKLTIHADKGIVLSTSGASYPITINGKTLGTACEKGIATSVSASSENLVTSKAVYEYINSLDLGGGSAEIGDDLYIKTITFKDNYGNANAILSAPTNGALRINRNAEVLGYLQIGNIKISDDNGSLKIEGNAYATGQLSSGEKADANNTILVNLENRIKALENKIINL